MQTHDNMIELPRYKSHKVVHALKIHGIDLDLDTGNAVITPADVGYGPFPVDAAYMEKHKPRIGGYYVVYQDGYKSWSPADAFEMGYTKDDGTSSPLAELKSRLHADSDYAWTWLCNLACIGLAVGGDHESANRYAAQFMRNAFDIDIRENQHWKEFEKTWADGGPTNFSTDCDKLITRLQSVIESRKLRSHAEMIGVAARLEAMSRFLSTLVLANPEA